MQSLGLIGSKVGLTVDGLECDIPIRQWDDDLKGECASVHDSFRVAPQRSKNVKINICLGGLIAQSLDSAHDEIAEGGGQISITHLRKHGV